MTKKIDEQFTQTLIRWYRRNGRDLPWRRDRQPYHVWVSEIMLQQTRVEAVRGFYHRFMETLPTIKDLAEVDEEALLKLWQGLGYYNRVKNLQKAAKKVMEEFDGQFPKSSEEIGGLPGIGEYTAGAISSICFGQPCPAVDGNVLRVMARIRNDFSDIKAPATKKEVSSFLKTIYPQEAVGEEGPLVSYDGVHDASNNNATNKNEGPKPGTLCGDLTQALIELGALVCVPNGAPHCKECPVSDFCQGLEAGNIESLPVKSAKKPRRKEEYTVFIMTCGNRIAVRRRPAGSLLAGLYEFPQASQRLSAEAALSQAQAWGCRPVDLTRRLQYKHVFTHVEWDMIGYYITCAEEGSGAENSFRWVSMEEMEKEIPLPSAFGYFWQAYNV
ncbi:MAG: A/G-specific adenine glycosylase [Firmicutes bacterium]|nr:A/G-specific adenine glycosylase [Bacillota bacterium]